MSDLKLALSSAPRHMPLPPLSEEQRPLAISLLTYRRDDFESGVLVAHAPLNQFNATQNLHRAFTNLGHLELLPLELFNLVLQMSDLSAISSMRSVNKRTRAIVDDSIPYKYILRYAPHLIGALLKTQVACYFTADHIFHILCISLCSVCGRFGAFMWIPECIRCCIPCLREAPELMPMSEGDAKALFGLSSKGLARVPTVVTVPGSYTLTSTLYRKRFRLVSEPLARRSAILAHGGEAQLDHYIRNGASKSKAACHKHISARATRSSYDSKGRLNNTVDDVRRFMVTVHLPYLDLAARTTHVGLSCKGCQVKFESDDDDVSGEEMMDLSDRCDLTYTEDGFFGHLEDCPDAQQIWGVYLDSIESRK